MKNYRHLFGKEIGISIFIHQWGRRGVLLFGLLIYLSVQIGGLQLPTIAQRSVPAEPDDIYSYILKSAQMSACFWQDCPAIEDLRQQLTAPSSDWDVIWERERQYGRIIQGYHPLFSMLLLGGRLCGLSWEHAYHVISIGGTVFILGAMAYWLHAMFGSATAGLTLILLALTLFQGQGLHFVIPSNLSLGIAMFTWSLLLRRDETRWWWSLPAITAVMVTMHPVGKIYAGVTLVAAVALRFPIRSRRTWAIIAGSAAVLAVSFIVPELIRRPTLTFHSSLPLQGGVLQEYAANIRDAWELIIKWANSYGGPWAIMAIILLAALFGIVPHQRRPMGVMVGMLATLMLGAFLFIYPGYLAVLVRRVYIPVIIFLTGLFSLAICRVLGFIWQAERKDAHAARQTRPGFSVLRGVPGKGVALLGLLGMLWMSGRHLVTDYREFQEIKYSMIGGFNIAFDDQQPAILQSPEHRCQSVLYLYEIPLYLFLSHDVYACDAVYYRALKGTPEETTWVLDNQHIRHVVTFNPLVNFATARDGGIWLLPGERLELHTVGAKPLDHLELYFDNRGSIVLAVGSRHGPGVSVSG